MASVSKPVMPAVASSSSSSSSSSSAVPAPVRDALKERNIGELFNLFHAKHGPDKTLTIKSGNVTFQMKKPEQMSEAPERNPVEFGLSAAEYKKREEKAAPLILDLKKRQVALKRSALTHQRRFEKHLQNFKAELGDPSGMNTRQVTAVLSKLKQLIADMKEKGLFKLADELVEIRKEYQTRLEALNQKSAAKAETAAQFLQKNDTADSLLGLFTSIKA